MTMNELSVNTVSTILSATSSAFRIGSSQLNLEVNDWNMPVDILAGHTVVKWMFSLAPPSCISLLSESIKPTTANFEALRTQG